MFLNKFIGDRAFYKKVAMITIPIMLQNGVTNLVSLVDNIMVGTVGTEQMSAVAIINQLLFVFNLAIFGIVAGVGIFTAQYFGKGDNEGIRQTIRLKLVSCIIILFGAILIFQFAGDSLIQSYLHESEEGLNLVLAFNEAKKYLSIMLIGLIPFAITQVYSGTLRETEQPVPPLIASVVAVGVNLVLNYCLILGKFGCPALGVTGAAIATVTSRYVELAINLVVAHSNKAKRPYMTGLYKNFYIKAKLVKAILPKAIPLLANETFWAMGMALLSYCYSLRGLDVVAASNICSTISNVFMIAIIGFGNSISIMVGGLLGANKIEEAKSTNAKLTFLSFAICIALGTIMALTSGLYPMIYNTTPAVKELAKSFITCYALYMPIHSLVNSFYFAIRSGGKTVITFLFDSVFMLCVTVPVTYSIARFSPLPVIYVYFFSQAVDIFKVLLGFILVKNGFWARNLVDSVPAKEEL